jgi:hypothetical protein
MIARIKAMIARYWPVLHLRTILFGTLLFVAALPGISAVFLRVYENALVRRTEAELVAQGAALSASAAILWPGMEARQVTSPIASPTYHDVSTEIDLRSSAILPERPDAVTAKTPVDANALIVAQRLDPAFAQTKLATLSSILMLDRQGIILDGRDVGKSHPAPQ